MTVDITKMEYPMLALGKVHVGKREYAAGSTFDALTIKNVNFFKMTKTAQMLAKPVATRKVVVPVADVVKTEAATTTEADSTESQEAQAFSAGAKGTSNDSQESSAPDPTTESPDSRGRDATPTSARPSVRRSRAK